MLGIRVIAPINADALNSEDKEKTLGAVSVIK